MSAALRRLAAWWRERPVSAGEAPWVARRIQANAERIEALEGRLAAAEAQSAATTEAFCRALMAAGKPVPDVISAEMPTAPMLRVVS